MLERGWLSLEKVGYQIAKESTEPNDQGCPPEQHADTLAGAIEPQIFVEFLQGTRTSREPLDSDSAHEEAVWFPGKKEAHGAHSIT